MAIYNRLAAAGFPLYWGDVDASITSTTNNLVVLTNTDGSQTRLRGTNFVQTQATLTGGTITSMERTDTAGTISEQITGLNYSATSFSGHLGEPNLTGVMQDVFAGDDTLNGGSGDDVLK